MKQASTTPYLDELRLRGDHLLVGVSWALGAISLGLSFVYGTLDAFLWIAVPTLAAVTAQVRLNGGSAYSRYSIATGFMVMSGLMIHQAHGMLEVHFFVFVLLAFLLYYRDWKTIVVGAGVIAVHHLVFNQMQRQGLPVWVFAESTGLHIVMIHAVFVVAESAILIVMSVQLRHEINAVGANPRQLAEISRRLVAGEALDAAAFGQVQVDSVAGAMAEMSQVLLSILTEVHAVVRGQAAGNFSLRVAEENRRGMVGDIAVAINKACGQLERAMNETATILENVAGGDLSRRIRFDAEGEFLRLKEQVNQTVDFLQGFCQQQQKVIEAACMGDFSERINAKGLAGYQTQLANGLNNLLDQFDVTLKAVAEVMACLSEGRLDTQLQLSSNQGRFEELAHHTRTSITQLSDLIGEVQSEAEQIKTAASEIALAGQDLSSRTEDQSAKLQRTASSAVQISATVKQNADNAQEANYSASGASTAASSGAQVVQQMVGTMHEINQFSSRIADIIGVIDGIAFQTNILALNAAVEAARAGEQGRGFAVVASEVRTLAQRSATAAKEIKQLITESVEKVAQGTQYVEQAGRSMEDIVGHIRKLAGLMSDITAASAEQAAGVNAISSDIAQMEDITQQNAAMVEAAAATAKAMDERVSNLTDLVCKFTLANAAGNIVPTGKAVSRGVSTDRRFAA